MCQLSGPTYYYYYSTYNNDVCMHVNVSVQVCSVCTVRIHIYMLPLTRLLLVCFWDLFALCISMIQQSLSLSCESFKFYSPCTVHTIFVCTLQYVLRFFEISFCLFAVMSNCAACSDRFPPPPTTLESYWRNWSFLRSSLSFAINYQMEGGGPCLRDHTTNCW